jgi:hypothetical protein
MDLGDEVSRSSRAPRSPGGQETEVGRRIDEAETGGRMPEVGIEAALSHDRGVRRSDRPAKRLTYTLVRKGG